MQQLLVIKKLRPNEQFTWVGEDLTGLTFVNPDVKKPTQKELDAAYVELEIELQEAENKAKADKASALTKLAALGLTEGEAKAVIGV